MLQVWGRISSGSTQKVLWACEELGLPYDLHNLGGEFGGNDTSDYLAMNPNGRVPTIWDGDFSLWESNACVRYLAAKYRDGSLYPEKLETRAAAGFEVVDPGITGRFQSRQEVGRQHARAVDGLKTVAERGAHEVDLLRHNFLVI